jgi:glycosyltransferase involved in cell wall biosynthesis
MLFSVVIPTYNRVHLLARTLDSVWRQGFTDFEVVVVDDGSNDGTQDYLRSLGDRIRIVQQANGGPGAARNAGIRAASGKYVALLDSDDLWFPWTLNIFARAVAEFRDPSIVGGQVIEFFNEEELRSIREAPYRAAWFNDFIGSSHYPYYVGSGTCALRREALKDACFPEDRLNAEDHDLILQLGVMPGFVRILSPVTLAWRRHSSSETGQLASTASGVLRLVARERSGIYPGGAARSRERHRILARHIRPTAVACLRHRDVNRAWRLYRAAFAWHLELGSWKYIVAFPILWLAARMRRAIAGSSSADYSASVDHRLPPPPRVR